MRFTQEVETPLGAVVVTLEVPTSDAVHRVTRTLASGAVLSRWSTEDGLEVRSLLVRYDGGWNRTRTGTPAAGCWGVLWTVLAAQGAPGFVVSSTVPRGLTASPCNGECLEAAEVESDDWVLTTGGPDDDLLSGLVEGGRLPESWRGAVGWRLPTGPSALATAGGAGVTWALPPLAPGEEATTYVAVAWAPRAEDDVTSWLAVDTTPTGLLRDAGLAPERPDRAGWDAVPRA